VSENDRQRIYGLFREALDVYGPTLTSRLVLENLITALQKLRCSRENLESEIRGLIDTIKESEPRVVMLNNLITLCGQEVNAKVDFQKGTVDELKDAGIAAIEHQLEHLSSSLKDLVNKGVTRVENGDFIVIHSVSTPVAQIISEAKRQDRDFKILTLEQDFNVTKVIMKFLKNRQIDHMVIPEYGLSHFMARATKLFLGAVAVTADNKVVCAAGSSGIVNTAHVHKLPIYLFLQSLKFSDTQSADQNIHRKHEQVTRDGIEYEQITHSHDLVDLNLVDHIVIEKGEIDKQDIARYRLQV
jgi:translation initiation factor eIF-2B subunit alpha